MPSLLGGFSLDITAADDCRLAFAGFAVALLPPLFSLSELPLVFPGANRLPGALGWAFGVPLRLDATDGGRLTEAADPGRRVSVDGLLAAFCCACDRVVAGEAGTGGGIALVGSLVQSIVDFPRAMYTVDDLSRALSHREPSSLPPYPFWMQP